MQLKNLLPVALATAASAQQMMDLAAALGSIPELSNLTNTVSAFPELVSGLSMTPNLTLLAPSNEAFAELLQSDMASALQDPAMITALLQYHVLNGTYYAANVTETPLFLPTALMNMTYENVTGGQVVEAVMSQNQVVFYSGLRMNSTVTQADIAYNNGIVHVIDSFLTIPANVSTTAVALGLSSVAGALTQAELVETVEGLTDVTIFAPSNSAFQNIGSALGNATSQMLTDILTYHVVEGVVGYSSGLMNMSLPTVQGDDITITVIGDEVFVNSAQVVIPNVLIANGVVHVIDNVLNPMNATATPDPAMETQMPAFSGASSVSDTPFTSGVPTPTAPVPTGAQTSMSSSFSGMAAMPMRTGAVGAAALFGGAALVYNM